MTESGGAKRGIGAFARLWFGQSVSVFGSEVSRLVLPLIAAQTLRASPVEFGLLSALETLPWLFLALPAGVWIDRYHRRPIMVGADLARAAIIGLIPLAYMLGYLSMSLLYAVAFGAGIFTVLFGVAYQSYLPTLVAKERLVAANAKMEASNSIAQVSGPAIAGLLVQIVTAPLAIVADAFSFLISAASLLTIAAREPEVPARARNSSVFAEAKQGTDIVWSDHRLRALLISQLAGNFFVNVWGAIIVLYAVSELDLSAGQIGLAFALGGLGGVIGASLATPLLRRIGVGRSLILAQITCYSGVLMFVLASPTLAILTLGLGFLGFSAGAVVYGIVGKSFRQTVVPNRLLGKVNATMGLASYGVIPLGSLVGGVLGSLFSMRLAIALGALGCFASISPIILSPLLSVRTLDSVRAHDESIDA